MKIKVLITHFVVVILMISCKNEPPKDKEKEVIVNKDSIANEIPLFWKEACKNVYFDNLFECNLSTNYQVELLNDPFKDLVVITLDIKDSLFDVIYYNRFIYRVNSKNNIKNSVNVKSRIVMVNPITKDTLFFKYPETKKIIIKKRDDIRRFFNETIWNIPVQDNDRPDFDGEVWRIKCRNGNTSKVLTRMTFSDSTYYSNIQILLDICKIKDYKYVKR
jgi:hypothetical protein